MKKTITSFILILFSFTCFGQAKSEIFVRSSFNTTQDFSFEPVSGRGLGIHLGIRPSVSWENWQPVIMLGYETISSIQSKSQPTMFWYDQNVRLQAILERSVYQSEKEKLWIGFGGSVAVGDKTNTLITIVDQNNVTNYFTSSGFNGAVTAQASLRYQNLNFSDIISFGYSMDWAFVDSVWIHGFSIYWNLR
ncbi:MAG: hypothetical protein ACXIUD_07085 [Mongoliitalea sp.]